MKSAKQKKVYRTTSFLLLTVLLLTVSLVGCSQLSFVSDPGLGSGQPTDTTPDDRPAIVPPIPTPPVYYNRYTGLACDEALLSCRPISVCIGNFDGNRQKGLSFADIMIEAPVGGDKTRLWAILTDPERATSLSSVATVRDYMMPLASAFGTISAYAGTTDTVGATSTVYEGEHLDYLHHNLTSTFQKESDGTLSTSGTALRDAAISRGYSVTDTEIALPYSFPEVGDAYTPSGNRVRNISFRYSMANTIAFTYQEETGEYLKEQGGSAHTDPENGRQLAFSNLLLLFHNVNYYHTSTDTTFSLDTKSGGDGYLYTGGGVVSVHWAYGADGTLSVTNDEGERITVNRGRTYIGMLRVTDSTTLIAK